MGRSRSSGIDSTPPLRGGGHANVTSVFIMARLILGVTGSVAAIRTPALFRALSRRWARSAHRRDRAGALLLRPGRARRASEYWHCQARARALSRRRRMAGMRYERGDPVLHIELRKWADMLIVAPLDANTLAKFATRALR